jgi:hypothetical protein
MEDAQELQNIIFTGSQGIFATVQQDIRRCMQLGFMERWPCSEALTIIGKCSRADTTEVSICYRRSSGAKRSLLRSYRQRHPVR